MISGDEPSEEKSGLGNVKVYLWSNPNNARNAEGHLKPSPLTLGCLGGAGALQPLGGDFAMNLAALQLSLIDLNSDEDDPGFQVNHTGFSGSSEKRPQCRLSSTWMSNAS